MFRRFGRGAAIVSSFAVVAATLIAGSASTPVGAKGKPKNPQLGERAVVHHQDAKVLRGKELKGLDTPRAALYDIGWDAAEPTIAIDSKGNIFVAAADLDGNTNPQPNAGNQVDVLRSRNDGKTWELASPRLGPLKPHAITLDPYIWMDEYTDRVYTIDLTVACSIMSWSDDLATSWLTNPAACGRPVNDHHTLFGGPPALSPMSIYESVLYYCWNDVASSSCGKSLNGGLTWIPTGSPAFTGVKQGEQSEPELCGGIHGHGVVGPDGSVYLPREWCGLPMLAYSRDEGATWTQVQVSNELSGFQLEGGKSDPSVAVDRKGNLYYTWVSEKLRLPYLSISKDGGETWSREMMIGGPGIIEANFATIDVGDPGKIAIAYYGAENSPGHHAWCDECVGDKKRQKAQAKYNDTTWNGYITISDNVFDKDPVFYTARLNDAGDPLIRGRCGPGRCGRVFDFIDVEIAPDGTPWAPIVDGCIPAIDKATAAFFDCVEKPAGAQNEGDRGLVGRLIGGPQLR